MCILLKWTDKIIIAHFRMKWNHIRNNTSKTVDRTKQHRSDISNIYQNRFLGIIIDNKKKQQQRFQFKIYIIIFFSLLFSVLIRFVTLLCVSFFVHFVCVCFFFCCLTHFVGSFFTGLAPQTDKWNMNFGFYVRIKPRKLFRRERKFDFIFSSTHFVGTAYILNTLLGYYDNI